MQKKILIYYDFYCHQQQWQEPSRAEEGEKVVKKDFTKWKVLCHGEGLRVCAFVCFFFASFTAFCLTGLLQPRHKGKPGVVALAS